MLAACGAEDPPLAIVSLLLEFDRPVREDASVCLDTTAPTEGGDTPLHLLVKSRRPKLSVMERILEQWPEVSLRTNAMGATALHIALANGHGEAAALLLKRCPAAAGLRDVAGSFPLHYALANPVRPGASREMTLQQHCTLLKLVEAHPEAMGKPNSTGHTALTLGLQSQPELLGSSTGSQAGEALLGLAFQRALTSAVQEEYDRAVAANRPQTLAILRHWHADRLSAAAATMQAPVDVAAWLIGDAAVWIQFVALRPALDSLAPQDIRCVARGEWPATGSEVVAALSDAGVDGRCLLDMHVSADVPVVLDTRTGRRLLRAIAELRGLVRASRAKLAAAEDAALAAREKSHHAKGTEGSLSIVYESLMETGLALVAEFKERRQSSESRCATGESAAAAPTGCTSTTTAGSAT